MITNKEFVKSTTQAKHEIVYTEKEAATEMSKKKENKNNSKDKTTPEGKQTEESNTSEANKVNKANEVSKESEVNKLSKSYCVHCSRAPQGYEFTEEKLKDIFRR